MIADIPHLHGFPGQVFDPARLVAGSWGRGHQSAVMPHSQAAPLADGLLRGLDNFRCGSNAGGAALRWRRIMGISHLVVGATFNPDSPIEHDFVEGLTHFSLWMAENHVTVALQERIGPYRADFVLRMPERESVVVECDGARYHSGCDQVRRDRERDQYMMLNGFKVYRIAGGELWRFPTLCARAALMVLSGAGMGVEENCGGHRMEEEEDLRERVRTNHPCDVCGNEDCDHGLPEHDCDGECSHAHRPDRE